MVVRCPQCGGQFKVPDTAVGKRGRCKHCQHVFVLTASNQGAAADAQADAAAELDGEPDGEPMMYAAAEPPESGGVLDALMQVADAGVEVPAEEIAAGRRAAVAGQAAAAGGPAIGGVAARRAAGGGFSLGAYRRPLLIGGGVVVGLVGAYLAWTFAISGYLWPGMPAWAEPYVTQDVSAVAYADVQKLRGHKLWSSIKDLIGEDLPFGPGAGLKPADLSAEMTLFLKDRERIHVYQANSAKPLGDVAGSKEKPSSYQNIEYMVVDGEAWAKLGDRVFCMARSEERLKEFLSGLDGGKPGAMKAELRDALSHVAKGDVFVAGRPPSELVKAGDGAEGGGFGITFGGDSVKVFGIMPYKDNEGAERCVKNYETSWANRKEQATKAPSPAKEEMMSLLALMEKQHLSQSGRKVNIRAEWTLEEFKKMLRLGLTIGL